MVTHTFLTWEFTPRDIAVMWAIWLDMREAMQGVAIYCERYKVAKEVALQNVA